MNPVRLDRIVLHRYKSIRECDVELKNLNVLIGPNGAGKSSFVEFLHMVRQIFKKNLRIHVSKRGGPGALLHFGMRNSEDMSAELYFDSGGYKFSLKPTDEHRMMFTSERLWWRTRSGKKVAKDLGKGHFETNMGREKSLDRDFVVSVLDGWRVYHFHDTSDAAPLRQMQGLNDNMCLREDAANLAPFLYLLKSKFRAHYERIVKMIRQVTPFFGDFILRPHPENPEMITLEWMEKGQETPFKTNALSDGTLRFICLATVLLQPEEFRPDVIIIDEPELGLHPYAIAVFAAMLQSASETSQVIIATQSTDLVNGFALEDIVVADRTRGYTSIDRLSDKQNVDWLEGWLDEYTLGELWYKNMLGGIPAR